MKDNIGVLLVQIGYDKDPDRVLARAEEMIEGALEKHPDTDVICLPELYYEGEKDKFIDTYKRLAKDRGVNIVTGSMPVMTPSGKPANTAFIINRDGDVVGSYSKAHLFDAYDDKESDRLEPGNELGIYDMDFGRLGVLICYDIRFPEYARTLALQGIDLLLVPAAFYRPRTDDWDVLLRSTALTNILYVGAANQFGKRCAGRSGAVDPNGHFIAKAPDEECVVYADLDMTFQKHMREVNPVFQNRRPDLYEL